MKMNKRDISEALCAQRISELLCDRQIRVLVFDEIDSTNTEARRQAEAGVDEPVLILANSQTAGRGRMGRSFYSPSGTGLYMSLLTEAGADLADTVRMTTSAAVAVASAIEELCGIKVGIKWVNDIYLHGRKICGILCESFVCRDAKRYAVIGIGINLYTEDFPAELRDSAASLFPRSGSRDALAAAITRRLCEYWESPCDGQMIEYYRERSVVLGKRVVFSEKGETLEGVAVSIDESGALRVRLDDGNEKILMGGEISLRALD